MEITISKVTNLIPVKINCYLDGQETVVWAYIDYDIQAVSEVRGMPSYASSADISDFTEAVKTFLKQDSLEVDIPAEVLQQYQKGTSFSINDYLTNENLNVQLKKNCKGSQNA